MAITFHVISTQLNAYRGLGGVTASLVYDAANGVAAPAVTTNGTTGVFGGNVISMSQATYVKGLMYPGGANMPACGPMSVRIRVVPQFTGTPSVAQSLWACDGFGGFNTKMCWLYWDTANKLEFLIQDQYGKQYCNATSTATVTPTAVSGTPIEFMAVWDGTATAGTSVRFSCNGVELDQQTALAASGSWDNSIFKAMTVGFNSRLQLRNFDLNELVVYNTAENHVYTVNAGFVTDTPFDGTAKTTGTKHIGPLRTG